MLSGGDGGGDVSDGSALLAEVTMCRIISISS